MGIQPVELEVKEGVRGNVWGSHGDRGRGHTGSRFVWIRVGGG